VTDPGDPQVLVVGAGPVGLALAVSLAGHGVAVRIVDKLKQPTAESRAIVVHARSLEMLERLGVAERLIDSGVRTTRMELHSDGETIAQFELDTIDSSFPFSVTTAQTETERVLTERLAELGVSIDRGVELVGFEQHEAGVRSRLRLADGSEQLVESAFVAGMDGSHSTVRAQLGLKLEGSFKGERFLLGDVEAEGIDRSAMHTYLSSEQGPVVVFPMLGQRARVFGQVDADAPPETPTLERLQGLVDRGAPGIRLLESHWLTFFDIHHAQVPAYRVGRAFLGGDAAHVHSPAGGQGMNTGMQDAFNLAWKLAQAVGEGASEALLDSYHAERHPVAAHVIEFTNDLTRATTLEGGLARRLRDRVVHAASGLAPIAHRMADETEEVRVAYRDSPIVAGRRSRRRVSPGEAAPDVGGLHAALDDWAHTIVSVGAAGEPVGVTVAGSDDPGTTLPDPERAIARRYGFGEEGGLVVVRPDGYVGLVAEPGDGAAVTCYFAALRP
jgi:2-polyprenyl-6-methoxyphenol hydroxylase-like FAD-dependent oxidoreductase